MKPVPWTTVLLFLGAFLVIVAAAIFSIVVWNQLGATGKLVLMTAVTAAFYGAGWYVRTKLEVPAGATALTTVASAMLLFDGWIAIEGYGLEGPLPWAVLLLGCSVVYWFTEVRLADRFFGAVGAAAQMGWWWLLGEGLGLAAIVRLAGMALAVVMWQFASERGKDDKTVGSLALVLSWAAPIAAGLLSAGVVADMLLLRTAGVQEVVAAAVVAGASLYCLSRTRILEGEIGESLAAVSQLPLFLSIAVARYSGGDAWWIAGGLAVLAVCYAAYAVWRESRVFAVLAASAGLLAALSALDVLDAERRVWLLTLAALIAVWHAGDEAWRDRDRLSVLAAVFEWFAPIGAVVLSLLGLAVVLDNPPARPIDALSAAVIAGVSWVVIARSRQLERPLATWISGALQAPLLAVLGLAWVQGPAWWIAAAFAALSFAYGSYALFSNGYAFAILAVVSELLAVVAVLDVAGASDHVGVGVLATLATAWAFASRMAQRASEMNGAPAGTLSLSTVARYASVMLLVASTVGVPAVGNGVPLGGVTVAGRDALLALVVLAAWAASTVARTREIGLAGTGLFSFYALAAGLAWLSPGLSSAWYAMALLVLAGGWLAGSIVFVRSFSEGFTHVARIVVRVLAGAIVYVGTTAEFTLFGHGQATVPASLLTLVGALFFAADTLYFKTVLSSVAASVLALATTTIAAGTIDDPLTARATAALAGPATAIGIVACLVPRADRRDLRQVAAAVTAAALSSGIALVAWGQPGWLAGALLLVAVAWVGVAALYQDAAAFASGLAIVGAAAAISAALASGPWVTVTLVGLVSLGLGAVSLVTPFGPGGNHARAGASAGIAGLVGLGVILVSGAFDLHSYAESAWLGFNALQVATLLVFAAAGVIVQGRRWDIEASIYVGWGLVLIAAWTSWGNAPGAVGEWYTTSLAVYLVAMGYVYAKRDSQRVHPSLVDAAATAIGLGLPLLWALTALPGALLAHFLWIAGLSLVAITLGVLLKVRWYFFGGVGALALVAAYRSFTTLAQYSWLLLGIIGIAMLVIAVTWEQQRSTRERLIASFQDWR